MMPTPSSISAQQGALMVVTLIMLLVMTSMGVGLLHTTNKESKQIAKSAHYAETLHSAETCLEEAIQWLQEMALTDVPCKDIPIGTICHTIGTKNMNSWRLSSEKDAHSEKLRRQFYKCDISRLDTVTESTKKEGETKPDGEESYDASDDVATELTYYSYYDINSYACASQSGLLCSPSSTTSTSPRRSVEVIVKLF